MTKKEECEGCESYNNSCTGEVIHINNNTCPCSICLVKTMCRYDCQPFQMYVSIIANTIQSNDGSYTPINIKGLKRGSSYG